MHFKYYWVLIKKTLTQWNNNKLSRLAAALAYYTIFSLAPLLIIAITISGLFLEKNSVQKAIISDISTTLGKASAQQIETMIVVPSGSHSSLIETSIGIIILLLGASGFFGQLQDSLNTVWGVEAKSGRGIIGVICDRFFSFTMVMGLAFLLLVSLLISIVLSALSTYLDKYIPGGEVIALFFNFILSLGSITLIFAMIFKILPDVILRWSDVWVGAFVTALLFTIGKFALAIYLSHANFNSTFGEAASLIIILVWVYYSSQILLIGAQFTKVYAIDVSNRQIKAAEKAVTIHITRKGSIVS